MSRQEASERGLEVIKGSSKQLEHLVVYVMRVRLVDGLAHAKGATAIEGSVPNELDH